MFKRFGRWIKSLFDGKAEEEVSRLMFPTMIPEIIEATRKWKKEKRPQGIAAPQKSFDDLDAITNVLLRVAIAFLFGIMVRDLFDVGINWMAFLVTAAMGSIVIEAINIVFFRTKKDDKTSLVQELLGSDVNAEDVQSYFKFLLDQEKERTVGEKSRFAVLRQRVDSAITAAKTKVEQVKLRIERRGDRAQDYLFDAQEKLKTALKGFITSKVRLDTLYEKTIQDLAEAEANVAEIVDVVDDSVLMREVDEIVGSQAELEIAVQSHAEIANVELSVRLNQFSNSVDAVMRNEKLDRVLRGGDAQFIQSHEIVNEAVEGLEAASQKLANKTAA